VLIDLLEDQPELGFDFLRLMASTLLELRTRITPASDAASTQLRPSIATSA
jgi:hypothetical protein